jgi:type II restriction enzyme
MENKINLFFDEKLADKYTSLPQKIRVLTEAWVDKQAYCPNCGHKDVDRYGSNRPVADFFCTNCLEDYELKSKKDDVGSRIVDGAYRTMMERLKSPNNPNLFLLNYDLRNFSVLNFFVIPKQFFVPDIIEKRKRLSQTARRAGWIGCNILLSGIPQAGKIFFIKDRQIKPKNEVLAEWQKTLFLREEKELNAKGWLLDIMNCIENITSKEFALEDVYVFEKILHTKHPKNRHIKDKIRQQLQILRDRGYLRFVGRGRYCLT